MFPISFVPSRRSLTAAIGLIAALVLMVGAAPALANTTIGNSAPGGDIDCGGQIDVADNGYTVPAGGGVITSLSSSANDPTGQFDLQVLRPNSDGSFTVVGNTGLHAQTTGGVQTYATNIAVSGGEVLGFYFDGNGEGSSCAYGGTGDGIQVAFLGADPTVGSTFYPSFTYSDVSLDVSANLVTTPPNKAACMNGGWRNYTGNDGRPFKNQGDCVSFIPTGGKNPANG